jgi:hypothetical protein
MKKWNYLFLLAALCLPVPRLGAQDKPKTEERAKVATLVKVQIVFAEYDGEKKLSSMPYTFTVISEKGHEYGTSLRTGIRVPIELESKDQKTTYLDIGTNIDCVIKGEDEGLFHLALIFDRSTVYPNKSGEGEKLVANPGGQPLIRTFRANENIILKDGQTSENLLSTDPLTGHTLRVAVTINVQK